jgi:hypothetical protein
MSTEIVNADKYGVLPQQMPPYPAGANSARSASIAMQQQSVNKQMSLIGAKGGSSQQIAVPPANTPYPDIGNQTANNFKSTVQATVNQTAQSAFDSCVGKGPGCTANVAQDQKAGSRRKNRRSKKSRNSRSKRGGLKWGCMSGGKKRHTKNRRYTRRRNKYY